MIATVVKPRHVPVGRFPRHGLLHVEVMSLRLHNAPVGAHHVGDVVAQAVCRSHGDFLLCTEVAERVLHLSMPFALFAVCRVPGASAARRMRPMRHVLAVAGFRNHLPGAAVIHAGRASPKFANRLKVAVDQRVQCHASSSFVWYQGDWQPPSPPAATRGEGIAATAPQIQVRRGRPRPPPAWPCTPRISAPPRRQPRLPRSRSTADSCPAGARPG